jgi:protein TonB
MRVVFHTEQTQMMNILLESKPRKQRKLGGTIFSVAFHSAIVFFAVYATARASVPETHEDRAQKVTFVKTKVVEPPKPAEPKPEPPKAAPKPKAQPKAVQTPTPSVEPPKGFKVLEAPIAIPTEIPQVDLSAKVTNEADFSGKGQPGGSGSGTGDASATDVDAGRNYAAFEVEQEVRALSGTSVAYPDGMRSSGAEGQVLAEFVVNEQGRVETGTFKVLESTNSAFTNAVKAALPRMRFRPAQIGNTKVSQVVQQAFVFKLTR